MIHFLDEIAKVSGLPFNEVYKDYKVVNLGGRVVYVQNYIKVSSYGKETIVLKVTGNEINIKGFDLLIKELSGNTILVTGKINGVFLSKDWVNEKKESDKQL